LIFSIIIKHLQAAVNICFSHHLNTSILLRFLFLQHFTISHIPLCKLLMVNDPIAESSANNNIGILLFPSTGVYAFSSIIIGMILCINILKVMGYDYSIVLHKSSVSLVQSLPHSSILYRIAFHHILFIHFTTFPANLCL